MARDHHGDARLVAAATYLLGPLSGALGLALRGDSTDVRFHATQSIVASGVAVVGFVALTFVQYLLTVVPAVGETLSIAFSLAYPLYVLVLVALWTVAVYHAVRGRRYRLPVAGVLVDRSAPRRESESAVRRS